MFLKLLILVFLLGSPATASVKLFVSKLGSQFSHSVSETTKSIKDMTKTMSDTINEMAHPTYLNKTGRAVPEEAKANPNQEDWRQLIDVRMDKSNEDEQRRTPTEDFAKEHAAPDVLDVPNPISILQEDEGSTTSNIDEQNQLLITDKKIGQFVPNLDSRIIFNDEVSNSKPPFEINIASATPIEVKGVPYSEVGTPSVPGHYSSAQTVDELLSQQNTHNTIKYSSSGRFEHKSSTVHKSRIPHVTKVHHPSIGNQDHGSSGAYKGNSIEAQVDLINFASSNPGPLSSAGLLKHSAYQPSTGNHHHRPLGTDRGSFIAPEVEEINYVPSYPGYLSSTGLLKHSSADNSVSQHQATKHSGEDAPFLGLFTYNSIPKTSKVDQPSTSSHHQGVVSQHQESHSWGVAGVAKQNVCSHGHPVFEPMSHGHSNFAASPLLKPYTAEDNDLATVVPGLIIITQQFTPINELWDRLTLLRRHHIPMVVYNIHPSFGSAEHREFLHNRASFPVSEVSSTELPSTTVNPSTEMSEHGDAKEEALVTVSTVVGPSGGTTSDHVVDEPNSRHGKDRQNESLSIVPRNEAAELDRIIFESP